MTGADGIFAAAPGEDRLLNSRLLARNAGWNLVALALPTLVALVTLPRIVRGFGEERFAVLTLAWTLIGYLSLFDFGLGRALTRLVAEALGRGDQAEFDRSVWTALQMMGVLGLLSGAVLALLGPTVLVDLIGVPPELRAETSRSVFLLGACLPVVVLSTAFRGILEAAQDFRRSGAVRIVIGVGTFALPALLLPFTRDLVVHVAALVALRSLGLFAFAALTVGRILKSRPHWGLDRVAVTRLLGFGAWITVSNVLSPIMSSFDRFFLGRLISIASVTYYAAPFDALTRTLILPGAVAGVLFPAFSTSHVRKPDQLLRLFWGATDVIFFLLYPAAFLFAYFAPELLGVWLGPSFAQQSSGVVRWLSIGVVSNGLAQIPYGLVQGVGRADLTAKLHLAEAPAYLAVLIWLARSAGIGGVALAWTLRMTTDMLLLFWLAKRVSGSTMRQTLGHLAIPLLGIPVLAAAFVLDGVGERVAVSIVVLTAVAALGWSRLGATVLAHLSPVSGMVDRS